MNVLGIDPGIRGGLAIVRNANSIGVLIDAIDIPVVGSGAQERVDPAAIRDWINCHRPVLALIERARAMPKQGVSSGFKYGRAVGAIEAAVVLSGVPIEIIEPSKWKRHFHLPGKNKERARQFALEFFSSAHALLARKRDHGRAEAALLGLYGILHSRLVAAPRSVQPESIEVPA